MPVPVESPSSTSVTDEVVTTARVVLPAESLSGGTEARDKVGDRHRGGNGPSAAITPPVRVSQCSM